MTIRLFTMGLKCFGRFDFIVLTFLRELQSYCFESRLEDVTRLSCRPAGAMMAH